MAFLSLLCRLLGHRWVAARIVTTRGRAHTLTTCRRCGRTIFSPWHY